MIGGVVLIALFTGYFSTFTPEFKYSVEKSCPLEQQKEQCDLKLEKQVVGKFEPPLPEGKVCCRPVKRGAELPPKDAAIPPSAP